MPISQDDRDIQAVFGHSVSIFDIQQAVEDGATVPIYFESRLATLALNQSLLPQVDQQVDDLFADEDDIPAAEWAKSRWAAPEALVGAEPRLKQVAADLVAHFEQRSRTQPGKAMVVVMSREICFRLYNDIVALRPAWRRCMWINRCRGPTWLRRLPASTGCSRTNLGGWWSITSASPPNSRKHCRPTPPLRARVRPRSTPLRR
jgi:hypothetical protein